MEACAALNHTAVHLAPPHPLPPSRCYFRELRHRHWVAIRAHRRPKGQPANHAAGLGEGQPSKSRKTSANPPLGPRPSPPSASCREAHGRFRHTRQEVHVPGSFSPSSQAMTLSLTSASRVPLCFTPRVSMMIPSRADAQDAPRTLSLGQITWKCLNCGVGEGEARRGARVAEARRASAAPCSFQDEPPAGTRLHGLTKTFSGAVSSALCEPVGSIAATEAAMAADAVWCARGARPQATFSCTRALQARQSDSAETRQTDPRACETLAGASARRAPGRQGSEPALARARNPPWPRHTCGSSQTRARMRPR